MLSALTSKTLCHVRDVVPLFQHVRHKIVCCNTTVRQACLFNSLLISTRPVHTSLLSRIYQRPITSAGLVSYSTARASSSDSALHTMAFQPRCSPTKLLDAVVTSRAAVRSNSQHVLEMDRLKYDSDVLLYSYNNRAECVAYNCMGAMMCAFVWAVGYYVYYFAKLEKVDNEHKVKKITNLNDYVAFHSHFEMRPYRTLLTAGFILSGVLVSFFVLRYTLRCVHRLVLCRDGTSLLITTSTLWGALRTRRVPVQQAYVRGDEVPDLASKLESCSLFVEDRRVSYVLDQRGDVHNAMLLPRKTGM